MSEGYAHGKTGVSGQRSGVDRRERELSPPEGVERREQQDRRMQWSPFNEWTSTLKRSDGSQGDQES